MDGISPKSLERINLSNEPLGKLQLSRADAIQKSRTADTDPDRDAQGALWMGLPDNGNNAGQQDHEKKQAPESNQPEGKQWILHAEADALEHLTRIMRKKSVIKHPSLGKRYVLKLNAHSGVIDLFDDALQDAILALTMEEVRTLAPYFEQSSGRLADHEL